MHPIIFLWAHPRCLSTAWLRMMIERGDFRCLLEPFARLYYLHDRKASDPHLLPDAGAPQSYAAIRAHLLHLATLGPLFVKDMSYYVLDYLREDADFVRRVRNTFIIREPASSILSYHRVKADVQLEEIGLERLRQHFDLVREVAPEQTPVVVDADDLGADPHAVVRAWCDALGLPFLPRALAWRPAVPDEFKGWSGWLDGVNRSDGLHPRVRPATAPEPAGVIAGDARLRALYEHHLPHYLALREHRLRAAAG